MTIEFEHKHHTVGMLIRSHRGIWYIRPRSLYGVNAGRHRLNRNSDATFASSVVGQVDDSAAFYRVVDTMGASTD